MCVSNTTTKIESFPPLLLWSTVLQSVFKDSSESCSGLHHLRVYNDHERVCSQVGMRSFPYLLMLLSSHICGRVPYSGKLSREKTFTNW